MNCLYFLPIIMLFLIVYITRQNETAIMKKIIRQRKMGNKTEMIDLAKRFIDKECIIYTFNSQLIGTVKEVSNSAILIIDKSGSAESVNLDFIVRIREYPRKKNGKKKSVVID